MKRLCANCEGELYETEKDTLCTDCKRDLDAIISVVLNPSVNRDDVE